MQRENIRFNPMLLLIRGVTCHDRILLNAHASNEVLVAGYCASTLLNLFDRPHIAEQLNVKLEEHICYPTYDQGSAHVDMTP